MNKKPEEVFSATGRRKTSTATVRLRKGNGKITVNKKDLGAYFSSAEKRQELLRPITLTKAEGLDVMVTVKGGGFSGQAGAIRHGIARALIAYNPNDRTILKEAGFLTRDSREKERKKPGLRKARKRRQFSKR